MKKIILIALATAASAVSVAQNATLLGRYTDGRDGASEIAAYDSTSEQLFVTNAVVDSVDIVDISNPASPSFVTNIPADGINSVTNIGDGKIAIAVAPDKQDSGYVVIYTTAGVYVDSITVPELPDMITVTPDGSKILVAGEGEPNDAYTVDPLGTVTIIDASTYEKTILDFTPFNGDEATLEANGFRVFGPSYDPVDTTLLGAATLAADVEPEYITVDANSEFAYVALQENNGIAKVDLIDMEIDTIFPLGLKDYSLTENAIDASNKDDAIIIKTWPVMSFYQPDAIASYEVSGTTYIVTANEGDGREYEADKGGFIDEARVKDLNLDQSGFTKLVADLQNEDSLGRLKTTINPFDHTGTESTLRTVIYGYGARSFSIWDEDGNLVYDSGNDFEVYIASNFPSFFNCNDGIATEFDDRSDDKGPEPEAITIGEINGKYYAFIGLERQGGIMMYDITDPVNPTFIEFINSYDVGAGTMTDIAPEGLVFVPAANSHTNTNLLIVSNEVSGTVAIYEIANTISAAGDITESIEAQVNTFPNPASDVLTIELPENILNVTFAISNSMGATVATGSVENNESINIANFEAGLYHLAIYHNAFENGVVSHKIVKK